LLWLVAFSLAKTPGPASGSSSSSSSSSASKDGQTTKVAPPKSALRGATTTAAAVSKLDTTTTGSRRPAVPVAPTHAVIVAGHAVLRLNKMRTADRDDASWYLLPYQRGQDFPAIIASHIQKGIDIARRDPNALLLFSGGQTRRYVPCDKKQYWPLRPSTHCTICRGRLRRDVGPLSEAASYYYLAEEKKWFSGGVNQRTFLEEYARDSFENLLFSLCRFREASGTYPQKVTVVGFDFKVRGMRVWRFVWDCRTGTTSPAHHCITHTLHPLQGHRFTDLHRKAIGYPEGNFTYVGLRPSGSKVTNDTPPRPPLPTYVRSSLSSDSSLHVVPPRPRGVG
jgi:hypothetical protein